MAIDFPAAPVAGQIFYGSNGVIYQYSSTYTAWVMIGSTVLQDGTFCAAGSGSVWAPNVISTWETANPPVTLGNVGGWYNAATGVFTPPAGRYYLFGQFHYFSSSAAMYGELRWRKNGVVIPNSTMSTFSPSANANEMVGNAVIVDANGTDTFDLQVQGSVLMSGAVGTMGAFPLQQAAQIPGTGSAWRQIARTVVAAPQATLDFQNIPADINDIEVRFDLLPVSNDIACIAQVFDAGGTIVAAGYPWSNVANYSTQVLNASPLASSTSTSAVYSAGVVLNYHAAANSVSSASGIQGQFTINNIRDAARPKHIIYRSSHLISGGAYQMQSSGAGMRNANGAISGVRLFFGTGNIAAGSVATLWGSP